MAADRQTTIDPIALALRAAILSGAKSRWERVKTAVQELGKLLGAFDVDELRELLSRLGAIAGDPKAGGEAVKETPATDGDMAEADLASERWAARLMEAEIIYSPTRGRYRLI